jgi:hypothetical protein
VYQFTIGLAEVGAAILLLSSRTAPLGALLFLPVIVNVVLVQEETVSRGSGRRDAAP